jgi:predicted RNA methylase
MFEISKNYLNKKCGLHLFEYQQPDPNNPDRLGIINSNGKFTGCADCKHITREEYNDIIPKIVNELFNAGVFKTLEYFNKDIDIRKIYEKLKKDKVDINNISAQKTSGSNKIIRKHQKYFYDVKNHNGESINSLWTIEKLTNAFRLLDKPNVTVNSQISELFKKIKYNPITIYSPIMTKKILEELDCRTVLDPCIGWGGRMVGTTCLGSSHYTGCEPCTTTFQGLEKIKNELNLESQVYLINKPVEEVLDNELSNMVFDCCLTSPPYYNLEIYSDEDTQSFKKFPTYESWLENFIDPIIKYVSKHCIKFSCWSVKNFETDREYEFQKNVVEIHEKYGWMLDREYGIKKSTINGPVFGDITYIFKKMKN